MGCRGGEGGKTDGHPCPGKKPSHLRVPHTPFSPSGRPQGHCSGPGTHSGKPSVLSLPLAPRGATLGGDFEFPGSCGCAGSSWQGMGERLGPQPVTFSVDAQAPMVEPELTEVGELHSLTDWQVSEASEEAELDEFCSRGGATHHRKRTVIKNKKMGGAGGEKGTHRETDMHTEEGRMREAEG